MKTSHYEIQAVKGATEHGMGRVEKVYKDLPEAAVAHLHPLL